MADADTALLDALLDAHVAFVLARLDGDAFAQLVDTEVDHALERAATLTLDEVVHRDSVKAVAGKYVAGFDLPGAIPEVVGDISARLRAHPANEAALGDLVARRHVEAFAQKVAELRPLRQRIARTVAESPVVQAWLADYLLQIATAPIAANRRLASRLPGVGRAISMGEQLAGGVLREADQRSRELAERTAATILTQWAAGASDAFGDDELSEALVTAWDGAAARSVGEVMETVEDDDLIDFIVIVFEGWLEFRETPYLQSLVETGVDYFFDTYGGFALPDLLAEFGLTRDDLVEEAIRFAPRVLDRLRDTGELEAFVRRQLADFYASPEARDVVGRDR